MEGLCAHILGIRENAHLGCGGGSETTATAPQSVCSLEGPETTGTWKNMHHRRPCRTTHSLNLWVQGLLESWDRGCLSAGLDREELH